MEERRPSQGTPWGRTGHGQGRGYKGIEVVVVGSRNGREGEGIKSGRGYRSIGCDGGERE